MKAKKTTKRSAKKPAKKPARSVRAKAAPKKTKRRVASTAKAASTSGASDKYSQTGAPWWKAHL